MRKFTKAIGVSTVALGLGVSGFATLGVGGAAAQSGFYNQYTITLVTSLTPAPTTTTTIGTTTTTVAPTTTTTAAPTTTTTIAPAIAGISKDFAVNVDTATVSGETDAVNAACSPTDTF